MKIQFHRIDTNVVVGLLVREFCYSGTDVSAKVLAMYEDTRTSPMEHQWLADGGSQKGNDILNVHPPPKVSDNSIFPLCISTNSFAIHNPKP